MAGGEKCWVEELAHYLLHARRDRGRGRGPGVERRVRGAGSHGSRERAGECVGGREAAAGGRVLRRDTGGMVSPILRERVGDGGGEADGRKQATVVGARGGDTRGQRVAGTGMGGVRVAGADVWLEEEGEGRGEGEVVEVVEEELMGDVLEIDEDEEETSEGEGAASVASSGRLDSSSEVEDLVAEPDDDPRTIDPRTPGTARAVAHQVGEGSGKGSRLRPGSKQPARAAVPPSLPAPPGSADVVVIDDSSDSDDSAPGVFVCGGGGWVYVHAHVHTTLRRVCV